MDIVDRFTILVVDDEPPICDILTRTAQKAFPQAQFVNTRSVVETYDYLDQQVTELPQLILLDIDLKEAKNGLDMLPELKHRLQGRVPIIMFSVQTERLKVQRSYQQGAVAYTQKPGDLIGWQQYVKALRDYWYGTATLPTVDPGLN